MVSVSRKLLPTRLSASLLLLAFALVPASSQTTTAQPSTPQAAAATAANGAAPGQPTAPKPATAKHLATLPTPLPAAITQDIDVGARSSAILAHLNEVIRFYRMSVAPIQKAGEPSDIIYAEQAQSAATQVAQLAFQSSRGESALLARIQAKPSIATAAAAESEIQKLSAAQATIAKRIQGLQQQDDTLDQQLTTAKAAARPALEQQKAEVAGQLELSRAASEALAKVSGISTSQTNSRLQSDIDQLQHSAPELVDNKIRPVANSLESIMSLRDSGVTSQAVVLFQLIGTRRAIDQRIEETNKLHDQALELRTPLIKIMRATLALGQNLDNNTTISPNASAAVDDADLAATRKSYAELTDAFRTISDISVPISQEVLLLEQSRGNLESWRAAVDAERASIFHALLLRVFFIAIMLVIILGLGEVWRRATARYVQDLRRRRQLLLVRRMVIGFLSGLVLILGFVSEFNSLATFAGFITAGIAVGLQTILLSVAAYFFIVGRYGVRVGDRITVAGVTGDVVEVGLVRFYMMELAGANTELHPTGRIAVFANSVLFQTGTPLYKQIPGTDYAWHEVSIKLKPGSEYQPAVDAVRTSVETVYEGYKAQILKQHAQVESWMDAAVPAPSIEARLQLTDGLQYTVRYPVLISEAGSTDESVVQNVLTAIHRDPNLSETIDGAPAVRAVIKT